MEVEVITQKENKRIQKMSHGGDRYRNQVKLDFSINVNPLGLPDSVKKSLFEAIDQVEYYPDLHQEELLDALTTTLCQRYYGPDEAEALGDPDLQYEQSRTLKKENILCGNGASELLMALIHAFRPKNVLLPVPSFSGYRWALNAENVNVTEVICSDSDLEAVREAASDYDMIFLTNPNNPTGRYWPPEFLEKLCQSCQEHGTMVLLDECFIELSDDPIRHSMISKMSRWKNLFILRAFTKSFAIPGVRLGYLLGADEEKIAEIAKHLPEWNLSIMAQKAGCACLKELAYLEQAGQFLAEERKFLRGELEQMGFEVENSVTNFMLIRGAERCEEEAKAFSKFLYEELLKRGTLIRDCSDYQGVKPGSCRIAVRNHRENVEFLQQVRAICQMWPVEEDHKACRKTYQKENLN